MIQAHYVSAMKSKQQRNICLILVCLLLTFSSPAEGGQIRLSGSGSTRCSGRVEILYGRTWGTVCDDSWDLNDAKVVCRQLNCGKALSAPGGAAFGAGSDPILLDDVSCSGSESSLNECGHRGFGTHDCKHSEDAGVVCSDVRLRWSGSGSTQCSGRVEILSDSNWGTVCDDEWDLNDAKVVCRQLNCGTALSAPGGAAFGAGSDPILLDDVSCSGSESFLNKCGHRGFGTHNCQHSEDAGVVCSASLPKPSISMITVGQVSWGQGVSISCSITTELLGGTFILKKTSSSFEMTQTPNSATATFNIMKVNFDHDGSYQCQYKKSISSQTSSSPLSDPIRLSVIASFPKPRISMIPVGQVSWGQGVSISCFITTELLGGTFILKKTSGSFEMTETPNSATATFNIMKVNFDHDGSYQCQYKKSTSSQTFRSPLSDPIRLSVTVSFQKPRISMIPVGQVSWGQGVSISCFITTELLGGTFILKKTSGSFKMTETPNSATATFNIMKVNFDHDGSYQCQYEKSISSQTFRSPLSDPIRLSVTVSFQKPRISMIPVGQVSWGQGVSISCFITTELLGGTFILKKTSGSFKMTETPNSATATFNIMKVNFDHDGSYQCQYEKSISSQTFRSPLSDPIRLSVTVSFQKPRISMIPVGQVSWGQGVSISCFITTELLGGTFILKKTSGSFKMTETPNSATATFNIMKVNFDHDGSYQCQYEKSILSQTFRSPLSDPIRLSVTVSFQKPRISMIPVGQVSWGQGVSISCFITTELLGGTFILKKTSGSFKMTETPNSATATFNIMKVNFDHDGSYQCQYEKSISSQTFRSPLSDPIRLSVTVSFQKPRISMIPVGQVSWGQGVSISCFITTELLGGTFILKKTSGSFKMTETPNSATATFNIMKVNFDHDGSYQCQYEKSISSQTFRSPLSDPIRLSVTVSFQKPRISMIPVGQVSWGQGVSISCFITTELLGGTFILKKTSGSFKMTETPNSATATFNIMKVNFDHDGSYQCQYEKSISSQTFRSPLSDPIRLSVTVQLQQPSISLTSPNKGLVWSPEGPKVTRGYSFVFLCSINCSYPDGRFFLISSDASTVVIKPAVNHSASFEFPVVEYEHQGNYSCLYEVELSSQRFNSTATAPIGVVITLYLLPLVSSVAAGILLLLLVVLMVVCVVFRMRQQAKQPETLVQTQMTARMGNCYDDDEDDEGDEEDYVNVETVETKNLKDKTGIAGEDSIYEEPDRFIDQVSEVVGLDSNMRKAKEVCFRANENITGDEEEGEEEKEEEVETSDEEDDYENVTEPLSFTEATVDIYGDDEDIYQNL